MQFRFTSFALCLLLSGTAGLASAQTVSSVGEVDASILATASAKSFHPTPHDLTNGQAHHRFGIAGIDSIPNFNGQFFADGFDANGNPNRHWYTNTVGNPPQQGGTTLINAPVQPVSVELDDVNGNLVTVAGHPLISDVTPFVQPALNSPVFSTAIYTSGADATQFSDAIQRAEFFDSAKPDWHTLLVPAQLPNITMHIRQSATCAANGIGCNYVFARNSDGSCCRFILADIGAFERGLDAVVGAEVASNSINTKDISTFLYPNTYLFFGGNPGACCVLGFHTFFTEPQASNVPEQRFVANYSSWISPGLFGGGFQDVTALSHEISETYNDPFGVSDGVHNLTPWYLSPSGLCQDNLESGDAIEGLPNAVFPITVNNFLYHPQNEALIQWFEFQSPSSALAGAYSYPDPSALPRLSAPQRVNCQ
jgi:hypothetical protein